MSTETKAVWIRLDKDQMKRWKKEMKEAGYGSRRKPAGAFLMHLLDTLNGDSGASKSSEKELKEVAKELRSLVKTLKNPSSSNPLVKLILRLVRGAVKKATE